MMLHQSGFQKGNKHGKGRIAGSKNNPDLSSLKAIMAEGFQENRPWIKECIMQMLNSFRKQLTLLNEELDNGTPDEKRVAAISKQRYYLLSEFKWLMELKERLEPKEVKGDINVTYTAEELLSRYDASLMPGAN